MAEPGQDPAPPARSEEEQNRPYRRFVRIVFALVILVISVLVLRGMIRYLDRLPSVDVRFKPQRVDNRALAACAEDLERLAGRIRLAAGHAFSLVPAADSEAALWGTQSRQFEVERLRIVARCRLDEASEDPVVRDLDQASNGIVALLREYNLLYDRYQVDAKSIAGDIGGALDRANSALRAR
jgi:hypothetical protein